MMQKVPAFETEHYELVWEPEEKLLWIALIGDQNEDIVEDYRRAIAILWEEYPAIRDGFALMDASRAGSMGREVRKAYADIGNEFPLHRFANRFFDARDGSL